MTSQLENSNFPCTIANLLKAGHTVDALSIFTDRKNTQQVHGNSWDLVPIVASYLTEDYKDTNVEVFRCCQKLINIVAEQSKADEVLLQFIEEIEDSKDDVKFLALLKPLEKVLLRVPDKRVTALAWCFNSIKTYLRNVDDPENFNLQGEERLVLDCDEQVSRITYLYDEVLSFCDTFVKDLATKEQKEIVGKFLVELLGKPLALLDMDTYNNTKPRARMIAEELMQKISNVYADPFVFLEMRDGEHGSDLIKPGDLSLGVFYYLMLAEQLGFQMAPTVYTPIFVFHHSIGLVYKLLDEDSYSVVEKGLHLAGTLLKNVGTLELPHLLLHSGNHVNFCKTISNVIVYNQCETVRKRALKILQCYMWSFEHKGRYLLIWNLMGNINHSGLKGNIVTQYKEMLTQEMCNNSANVSTFYSGNKLYNLLNEFTFLKRNEESDLVNESDQIISTLNLLRYIIIADKTGVCTKIDSYLDRLGEGYFNYLKTGIELSKEHYNLKLRELRNDQVGLDSKISVTVAGKKVSEMPPDCKMQIVNLSLTTLDVIDSLLSRVLECINLRNTVQ